MEYLDNRKCIIIEVLAVLEKNYEFDKILTFCPVLLAFFPPLVKLFYFQNSISKANWPIHFGQKQNDNVFSYIGGIPIKKICYNLVPMEI